MIAHCDKCGKQVFTAIDPESLDTDYDEVVCKSCRDKHDEAAYDRQQQRLMEDGPPDTSKADQELRDAGRGHLVR
jgi:DNA-directed RNA polymerase subunit RPC12/RpoP